MADASTIVIGCVAFGKPKPTSRDHPLASDEQVAKLLEAFVSHGGTELDTAHVYQNGQCEALLGRLSINSKLTVATKYHPNLPGGPEQQLLESLASLQTECVPIFYIHQPATTIPLEITLAEINNLHKAGKFLEFGLSNFPAWQVVEVCQYCKRMNYVMPTVYQGVYNALNRTSEYELVPVLRNYNIKYYSHGSLASGFLTGKYKKGVEPVPGVDRFAQKARAEQYQRRYLKRDDMYLALDTVTAAAEAAGMTVLDAAIRWIQHHSAVDASRGDKVLIGVSRFEQLPPIMEAAKKGPLPPSVVEAFDAANDILKMKSEYYLQYPYPKEGSPWNSRL